MKASYLRGFMLLSVLLTINGTARAQETIAIVQSPAPIILRPEAGREPLTTAEADTRLIVLERKDDWVRVEFNDRMLGRRIGWIAADSVIIVAPKRAAAPAAATSPAATPLAATLPSTALSLPASAPARVSPTSGPAIPPVPHPPAAPAATSTATRSSSSYALSSEQIDDAIAFGTKGKNREQGLDLQDSGQTWAAAFNQSAGAQAGTSTGFSVVVYTPIAWIRSEAAKAAKEYRALTPADVRDSMRQPILRVIVNPDTPTIVTGQGTIGTSSVSHVVLRDEGRRLAVQPLSKSPVTQEVSNAMGGRKVYEGLIATFSMDDLREIRGPKGQGEFFITVVGSSGEEKDFKVKSKHFSRLP